MELCSECMDALASKSLPLMSDSLAVGMKVSPLIRTGTGTTSSWHRLGVCPRCPLQQVFVLVYLLDEVGVGCVIPPLIGYANSLHSILPSDKFRSLRIELALLSMHTCIGGIHMYMHCEVLCAGMHV